MHGRVNNVQVHSKTRLQQPTAPASSTQNVLNWFLAVRSLRLFHVIVYFCFNSCYSSQPNWMRAHLVLLFFVVAAAAAAVMLVAILFSQPIYKMNMPYSQVQIKVNNIIALFTVILLHGCFASQFSSIDFIQLASVFVFRCISVFFRILSNEFVSKQNMKHDSQQVNANINSCTDHDLY